MFLSLIAACSTRQPADDPIADGVIAPAICAMLGRVDASCSADGTQVSVEGGTLSVRAAAEDRTVLEDGSVSLALTVTLTGDRLPSSGLSAHVSGVGPDDDTARQAAAQAWVAVYGIAWLDALRNTGRGDVAASFEDAPAPGAYAATGVEGWHVYGGMVGIDGRTVAPPPTAATMRTALAGVLAEPEGSMTALTARIVMDGARRRIDGLRDGQPDLAVDQALADVPLPGGQYVLTVHAVAVPGPR